jgi:hemoglobin-like flavoprotein
MTDPIYQSLELVAERSGDITEQVYQKYFASSPESGELMEYVDPGPRGKMIDEILRLVMVEDYHEEEGYLNWEVDNHEIAYSVKPEMYDPLFGALIDTVREAVGADWTDDMEEAWRTRTSSLRQEIIRRFGN